MAWAKAPVAIGAATFAASLAIAGTLTSSIPAAQDAARQLEAAKLKLAALSDIDAFSALGLTSITDYGLFDGIPAFQEFLETGDFHAFDQTDDQAGYAALSGTGAYQDFFEALANNDINGAIDALGGIDATSALPVYRDLLTATTEEEVLAALGELDSTSAIPPYVAIARAQTPQEAAIAMGDLDSLSAVDTFFGDGPEGHNGNPIGPVFGDGGVNALAPAADGSGGYAALSALPVFVGDDDNAPFGKGLLTGGGIDALKNYDALSAIPAYVDSVQAIPLAAPAPAAPEPEMQSFGAGEDLTVAKNEQGVTRDSLSFKPKPLVLFGNPGDGSTPEEGMRGYGNFLKKLGLNGGPDAEAPKGAEGGTP